MPEIADQLDEMVERLYMLGADEDVVATVRQGWDTGDAEEKRDYRERLRRLNDTALAAEIRLAMENDLLDEGEADAR